MILIAGVDLSIVSWVGERHSLTKTHLLLLISTSSAARSPVAVKLILEVDRNSVTKTTFKGLFQYVHFCLFIASFFPLRSQTCKLLFKTISDPTTLHFTAEGKLNGFDLVVIFALIIQLKHFFCLLTFSCSD